MIQVTELHKKFKTFHALKGITMHVKKGEIYGFIGKNGSGKSTTMNILAGLSHPSSGKCIVGEKDVSKIDHPSELNIGYLPEDPKFYPWMSAFEILDYLVSAKSNRTNKGRINEMLSWVGLEDAAQRHVGGFSRGMKQRLGIATALIHNPEIVILDEPSSALDPEGRSDVLRLITDLKQMGKTVVFSTHILSDVQKVCDKVGIIATGRMITEKPLSELIKENIVPIYDIKLKLPADTELTEKIKELEGITRVENINDMLSATVTDTDKDGVRLMQYFTDQKLAIRSFELRKNNLEDIFIQEVNGK